jgi:hypothetical protein
MTGDHEDDEAAPTGPRRGRAVVRLAAVAVLVLASVVAWQRYFEGAPDLGDQGAVTGRVTCIRTVIIDLPEGQVHSADGDPAPWPEGEVAGRLDLSGRSRRTSTRWEVSGTFTADDGRSIAVRGEVGDDATWMELSC